METKRRMSLAEIEDILRTLKQNFTKEDSDFLYDCYTSAKFLNNKADKKMLLAILSNAGRSKEDFVILVKFSQLRTTIKDACVSAEAKEIAERISNYKL
jgi:hypothetical protein